MITSIEMKKFRGIVQGKLEDLTPLVILVGPNASGKSTVLDALGIGAGPNTGHAIVRAVLRHHGVRETARWLFTKGGALGKAEISVHPDSSYDRLCELRLPEANRIECHVKTTDGDRRSHIEHLIVTFGGEDEFRLKGTTDPLPGVPESRFLGTPTDPYQKPLDVLLTESTVRGNKSSVTESVSQLIANVKDIIILSDAGAALAHVEYSTGSVPVALAGNGIYRLVRILLELATTPEGVVLIEEPEVHMHPAALRQTVRAILAAVRRNVQVVLTTHSLELIDLVIAESANEDLERTSLYQLELESGNLIGVRYPGADVAFARMQIEKDLR